MVFSKCGVYESDVNKGELTSYLKLHLYDRCPANCARATPGAVHLHQAQAGAFQQLFIPVIFIQNVGEFYFIAYKFFIVIVIVI